MFKHWLYFSVIFNVMLSTLVSMLILREGALFLSPPHCHLSLSAITTLWTADVWLPPPKLKVLNGKLGLTKVIQDLWAVVLLGYQSLSQCMVRFRSQGRSCVFVIPASLNSSPRLAEFFSGNSLVLGNSMPIPSLSCAPGSDISFVMEPFVPYYTALFRLPYSTACFKSQGPESTWI